MRRSAFRNSGDSCGPTCTSSFAHSCKVSQRGSSSTNPTQMYCGSTSPRISPRQTWRLNVCAAAGASSFARDEWLGCGHISILSDSIACLLNRGPCNHSRKRANQDRRATGCDALINPMPSFTVEQPEHEPEQQNCADAWDHSVAPVCNLRRSSRTVANSPCDLVRSVRYNSKKNNLTYKSAISGHIAYVTNPPKNSVTSYSSPLSCSIA